MVHVNISVLVFFLLSMIPVIFLPRNGLNGKEFVEMFVEVWEIEVGVGRKAPSNSNPQPPQHPYIKVWKIIKFLNNLKKHKA